MTKSMTLRLDSFGQRALSEFAEERCDSASTVVRMASLYYLADRDSGRPAWRVPRFKRDPPHVDGLDVDLDDITFEALRQEAIGQGVEPARLAEHALLYYLADLDDGRLAERIGGAVTERKKPPR
jgi:predicted transcriptional regulator